MSKLRDLDRDPRFDASRVIRAPSGAQRACKNWLTEARPRLPPKAGDKGPGESEHRDVEDDTALSPVPNPDLLLAF